MLTPRTRKINRWSLALEPLRHLSVFAPLFANATPRRIIMDTPARSNYDPRTCKMLTFHDATTKFRDGSDTPRAYLERCVETITAREPVVKAFVTLNTDGARAAADASSTRWKAGKPLSAIDGMPVAIKDLLETKDMPTDFGCAAYKGNHTHRDNAAVWALREAGAVVFGKTVTAELGGSHPGPTTNPWDAARTPGGSSSGTAAAIAARMVPAGLGTQVGGSVILRQHRVETHARRHQPRRTPSHQPEHHRRARRQHRRHVAGRDRNRAPRRRRSGAHGHVRPGDAA
jgi:hypothetical protein